jgi:hypothetical protein
VLHLMGAAGPKGREGASDQRKGVISQVRFGESRLSVLVAIDSEEGLEQAREGFGPPCLRASRCMDGLLVVAAGRCMVPLAGHIPHQPAHEGG